MILGASMVIELAGAAIERAGAETFVVSAAKDRGGSPGDRGGVMIAFGRKLDQFAGADVGGDGKAIVHASSSAERGWELLRFGGAQILFDRERSHVAEESIRVGELSARVGEERIRPGSEHTRGGSEAI